MPAFVMLCGMFRDAVRDVIPPRFERSEVGNVDYHPPAIAHRASRRLRQKERRAQIQREHRIPVLDQNLADRRSQHYRRRVHEHIE